ncbi:HD domain-containing protein [Candidatus Micrarchaeota archaeon]|nr:HD domain-containing protein [Candidatus Micrarchaeota archaeon]MBU1930691.1 HD domain-containing protein [Candidatus Micrarchaeota archaeon]
MVETTKAKEIEDFVRSRISDEFVDKHILLVVKEAKWLCGFYPEADKEVVETAALLHDVGQTWVGKPPHKTNESNEKHHIVGRKIAETFLPTIGFPAEKIPNVLHCIESHRTRRPPEPETIEAKIVASADNLAHFTGVEFLRENLGEERVLAKLERDLSSKFLLPEALAKAEKEYKKLKKLFQV